MAVPDYASSGVARQIEIGAYVGIPIVRSTGDLFGTLCGLDPHPQPESLLQQAPLLHLLGNLLSTILDADLHRTEAERAEEQAELAADSDRLTGALNRRGWDRCIALEEARFQRFGDPGGVIVIDLDRTTSINDVQDHLAGDQYVKRAVEVIRKVVRPTDVLARLGGDGFGVLVRDVMPCECDRLVAGITVAFDTAGVSGSIGHSPYTIVAGFPAAIDAAAVAMWVDKERRRSMPPCHLSDDRPPT